MAAKRASLLLLAALLGACATTSRDYAPAYDPPTGKAGRSVEASPVSLVVEAVGGAPMPTYALGDALFVEGREGEGYVLRLTNHTPERYEAVVTVDGRDVISGELGKPAKQRGYVLGPYESVLIDGYRRSLDEVASFYFSPVYDSYSARRGSPENAGVIGVALFEEKVPKSEPKPLSRRPTSAPVPEPFPAAGAAERSAADSSSPVAVEDDEHLGTGYGAAAYSPVYETEFKRRRRRPNAFLTLYYDSFEGLQARGIIPRRVDPYDPYVEPPRPDPVDPRFAPPPWERDR